MSCALVTDTDKVVNLVSLEIGSGPINLVLPIEDVGAWMGPATIGQITSDEIVLDGHGIHWRDAELWDPSPDWHWVQEQIKSKDFFWSPIIRKVSEHAGIASFEELTRIIEVGLPDSAPISEMVIAFEDLIEGALEKDHRRCQRGASALAGWGVGLTPVGDDFIAGFLFAIYALQPLEVAVEQGKWVLEVVRGRTTSLSKAFLIAAAEGKCGQDWHSLITGMVTTDPPRWKNAIHSIMNTGHTSGPAALAGFLQTIQAYLPLG